MSSQRSAKEADASAEPDESVKTKRSARSSSDVSTRHSTRDDDSDKSVKSTKSARTSRRSEKNTSKEPDSEAAPVAAADASRGKWANQLQFILSCVGVAVGLGNIWRFPSLAYQHGGGAFLIPYVICATVIGLPVLYFEFLIGQFTKSGPSSAFRRYVPAFAGLGWGMTFVVSIICLYYNVILCWIVIYIVKVASLETEEITRCGHWWNTEYCTSTHNDVACAETDGNLTYFVNNTCYPGDMRGLVPLPGNLSTMSAAEEFFTKYVIELSDGFEDMGGVNWKIFGAQAGIWFVIAVMMSRGVEWMGKISYVTSTVPYLIIAVLFVRGVTLEGASTGIEFYLLKPNLTKLTETDTWVAAMSQVSYTLSVGQGVMISLSSYNQFSHNCFRDAVIVTAADSFMSVFGGVAVFSTLGFLAKKSHRSIDEVVQSGSGVAFVAYPEAASHMPYPWIWTLLFMFMILFLGVSTQIGIASVLSTSLMDTWPHLRKRRALVVFATCILFFAVGMCMCFKNGQYFFELIDGYSGSSSLCLMSILEVIVIMYLYGVGNFFKDIRSMVGPPKHMFGRLLGPTGYIFYASWLVIVPLLGTTVLYFSYQKSHDHYGKGDRMYMFPQWALYAGMGISAIPILPIPFFFIKAAIEFSRKPGGIVGMFKAQPDLLSYPRIHGWEEETTEQSLENHKEQLEAL